jgi:LPS-assembly protein
MNGLFGLSLTDRWSILGGLRYDIDDNRFITNTTSLRYQDDCFMMSVTYDEFHFSDPEAGIEPDQTVMLRLEYKYLGGFNYSTNISQNSPTDQGDGLFSNVP